MAKYPEWTHLDHYPQGSAPYVKDVHDRRLNIQPMYGDGQYFSVSIHHAEWIFHFKKRFRNLAEAKSAAERISSLLVTFLLA